MPDPAHPILVLVRDLMFASKIRAEANAAGVPAKFLRDPAALRDEAGSKLIVDLNQDGAIPAASAWRAATGNPAIGFVSHVDKETIAAARAAGIDQVMARSRFVELLPDLMKSIRRSGAPVPSSGTPGEG